MKKIVLFILTIVFMVSIAACSAKKSDTSTADRADGGRGQEQIMPAAEDVKEEETKSLEFNSNYTGNIDTARKIIYNASATINVKDLKNAHEQVVGRSQNLGGYVSNSNSDEAYSQIIVRVPSSKLGEFLDYLKTLGEYKNESISTDDITDQYTDTEARLKNLKAEEEQLHAIMKKANTVDEVLKVQAELSRVRGDIEVMEGRINMWDKLMELSTVTVMLYKMPEVAGKDVKISLISFTEMGKNIANGFKSMVNFIIRLISSIIVVIVSLIPLSPFVAIAAWIVIRYRKKRKQKKENTVNQ